jgi:hypothetical protein
MSSEVRRPEMSPMQTGSPSDSDEASPRNHDAAVDYLRELEASLRYWYSAAETKAQVVLTLNGVFLAFLTGSILTNRDNVAQTVSVFGPETWVFLAGMAAGVGGSVICAVACLMARGVRRKQAREKLTGYHVDRKQADTYKPEVTAFFAFLAELLPDQFAERMLTIDLQFVVRALAIDHIEWSKYIRSKHLFVNWAFVLTGVTLWFFMCVGVSYLIRVSLAA